MNRNLDNEVILTIGASASGKSTWTKQYLIDNDNYVEINRDEIRFNLFTDNKRDWTKYKFSKANEKRVTDVQEQLLFNYLVQGKSVIISDTNLNPKIRSKFELWAKTNCYQYSEVLFPCAWDELIKRSAQREGGLREHIMWRQYKNYMQQFGYIGDNKVEVYQEDVTLDSTIWCDLDGCIADMTDVRKPFEWDKVSLDKPRNAIIDMLVGRAMRTKHITFMSGRDGVCYDDTYSWIEQNVDLPEDITWELYLRDEGDWRKDDVIKYELYKKHIQGKYNVDSVFDDRYSVIRMQSVLGLPNIIQVGDYNNEF